MATPKSAMTKYSCGPNSKARMAKGGARKRRAKTEIKPPIADPMVERAIALGGLTFLGHRVTVKQRAAVRWGSGNVQQNGTDGAGIAR